jgi:hypothetical protein
MPTGLIIDYGNISLNRLRHQHPVFGYDNIWLRPYRADHPRRTDHHTQRDAVQSFWTIALDSDAEIFLVLHKLPALTPINLKSQAKIFGKRSFPPW